MTSQFFNAVVPCLFLLLGPLVGVIIWSLWP